MAKSARDNEKANAIEKALQILMLFQPYNRERTTTEVSQELKLHKATASRTLLTLGRHGFLQQHPQSKAFRLGPAILQLATAMRQSLKTDLVQIAKPHVDALRDAVNETAGLEVLSGDVTVLAYLAEGARPVRTTTSLGTTLPIHAAAGAKAIFAYSPKEAWASLFKRGVAKLTERTITDAKVFERQLKQIHGQGFAVDLEEIDDGVNALGAPVFNHEGHPVAAVVVIGPADRITPEPGSHLVNCLREAAEKVSAALHYTPSD